MESESEIVPEQYWEIVGLDPRVNDEATIHAALKAAKKKWRDESGGRGEARFLAELCIQEQTAIEKTLLNPSDELRKRALARLEGRKEEARAYVREALRQNTRDGTVKEAALKPIIEKGVRRGLTETEVRKLIPPDVLVTNDASPKSPELAFPPGTMEEILVELRRVGKEDLYEFLAVESTSTGATLADAISALARNPKNDTHNPDVRIQITLKLIGRCRDIFGTPEKRRVYDHELRRLGLMDLQREFNDYCTDSVVSPEQFERLLQLGRVKTKGKLPDSEIEAKIVDLATKQRKHVQVTSRQDRGRPCGICGATSPSSAKACGRCGRPLEVECPMPSCKTLTANDQSRCNGCGFPIGDLAHVERLVAQARVALDAGKEDEAREVVQRLDTAVLLRYESLPLYQALRQHIASAAKADSDLVEALQKLATSRKFVELRRRIGFLKENARAQPTAAKLLMEAGAALREADMQVATAQRHGPTDSAYQALSRAVALVDDHDVARGLLSKIPLAPATDVRAVEGQTIDIVWRASPAIGRISYDVVRKVAGAPRDANDGERLATVVVLNFTDSTAEPGAVYYYAVFAERERVRSVGCSVGPVVALGEVRDFHVSPGDNQVSLAWGVPKNAQATELFRAEGNGVPVTSAKLRRPTLDNSARETDVKNGVIYTYLLRVAYRLPDGSVRYSKGVTKVAKPRPPLQPVKDLRAEHRLGRVQLSWTSPPDADVALIRTRGAQVGLRGELPLDRLKSVGDWLQPRTPGRYEDRIADAEVWHYLPVTLSGSFGIVGVPVSVISVEEVTGLKVIPQGNYAQLKWIWPPGVRLCRVRVSGGMTESMSEGGQASHTDISLSLYEQQGGCTVHLPDTGTRIEISVSAGVNSGETWLFAGGTSPGSRHVIEVARDATGIHARVIMFEVTARMPLRFIGKGPSYKLLIRNDGPTTTLPELYLVTNIGRVPTGPAHGEVVGRIAAGEILKAREEKTFSFDVKAIPSGARYHLFAVPQQGGAPVNLKPIDPRREIKS